jgi:hypothetical protein
MLRDPVAEFRSVVIDSDQVEPAEYRAILGNEHVQGAHAGLLLSQQGVVPVGELSEEVIAAVGYRGSEVGPVRQFEGKDRRGMTGMQPLQLGHCPTLPRQHAEITWFPPAAASLKPRAHSDLRRARVALRDVMLAVAVSCKLAAMGDLVTLRP